MALVKKLFTYVADVIPTNIPGLLGCRDMAKLDVHYSVKTGSFVLPGLGGLNIQASPGTEIIPMTREGEWCHWFLPCCQHLEQSWAQVPEAVQLRSLRKVLSKSH